MSKQKFQSFFLMTFVHLCTVLSAEKALKNFTIIIITTCIQMCVYIYWVYTIFEHIKYNI